MPSIQVPPFLQGLLSQSLISATVWRRGGKKRKKTTHQTGSIATGIYLLIEDYLLLLPLLLLRGGVSKIKVNKIKSSKTMQG